MTNERKSMLVADKESRSVVDERNAAKPDTGSSEDRQHENPCPDSPTCGIAGCVGKHHPQDHNAIIDARTCAACHEPAKGDATIDGERYCHEGASPTCYEKASRMVVVNQCIAAERDALRAELERVKAERNTIHDWYVDAKTENVRLRAEVERMRPVVEAAIAVVETDKRLYHGAAEHAEAEAEAAFTMLDEAVDAYRKDTNDE